MIKCHICGKSTATSQGLAGHRWLKHGEKTAQQAQAAQPQGLASAAMVQVPAGFAQPAQVAQPQQCQGTTLQDSKRTVTVSPLLMAHFDYLRDHGYEGNLEDLITEMVQDAFARRAHIRLRLLTPA